jgi:hypothetical protein
VAGCLSSEGGKAPFSSAAAASVVGVRDFDAEAGPSTFRYEIVWVVDQMFRAETSCPDA